MDEVTKLLKSLSVRMERLELEGNHNYKNPQNIDNRGPRDQRRKDRYDQKIQATLQNNLVIDEEEEEEDLDPEIHLADTSSFPHLTQYAYEESLMDSQLNDLRK
jgi:hypothetical protein